MYSVRQYFLIIPCIVLQCLSVAAQTASAHPSPGPGRPASVHSSPGAGHPGHPAPWQKKVVQYVYQQLSKQDGGFGWDDQPDGHLTPTFAVTGILNDLHLLPADRRPLISYITDHHPQFGTNAEGGPSGTEERDLIYQQIQGVLWLGGDASAFRTKVEGWKPQINKVSNFEDHGYPVFIQEMMTPICRSLLQMPLSGIVPDYVTYLKARRRSNGSYNNVPVTDGGDGNILNTYWGIYTGRLLDQPDTLKEETADWIRSCQLKNGGFTWMPDPVIGANDDVAYTWAAVKSLQLLSARPADETACIRYLVSLQNADGGFGRQHGLPSDPMATYYAIDALQALNAFSSLAAATTPVSASANPRTSTAIRPSTSAHSSTSSRLPASASAASRSSTAPDFSGLKIFTVQFEAQGTGSPEEAVMLADSLHINLWGAKNDQPGWTDLAQKIADQKKVPVIFFRADEPYGKLVQVPGLGTFSHILDYISPVSAPPMEMTDRPAWQQFRKTSLQPLLDSGGALIWQVSNNEPLARILLDETVKNGAYAGISTIHFGQNFLFWLPFLNQYRHQIPFIALQDAHGTEAWWWANELSSYRTLFLAKEPTYKEMMKAFRNNWIVAVRHDSTSRYRTRMMGGGEGVREYVSAREEQYPPHPWAAITVVSAKDSFETARPDKGINIRIRCWWKGSLYILKDQVVELQELKLDDAIVSPEYKMRRDKKGELTDAFYTYLVPQPAAGRHTITVRLHNLKDNSFRTVQQQFSIL